MNDISFSINGKNIKETLNGFSTFDQVKKEFLDGKSPVSCRKCFFQESQGGISARISRNSIYQKDNSVSFEEMVENARANRTGIVQVFMFFSNLCNLACRMCVPESSSTIASMLKVKVFDENKISDEERVSLYLALLEQNKDTLKKITFSGGEFFMDPGCYAFFNDERVKEILNGLEKVIINTNASKIQHGKLDFSEFLRTMDNIVFGISIDGPPGPVLDYIREKIRSDDFDKTVRYLIDVTGNKKNVFFSFTLQAYNLMYVTETLQYLLTNFDKNIINIPLFRWVFNKELDIRILPKEIIEKALTKMDAFDVSSLTDNLLVIEQFETLKKNVRSILHEPRDFVGFEQFKQAVKSLDAFHGTDVLNVLPELEGQL